MSLISNIKQLLLSYPTRKDLEWALVPLKVEQRAERLKQNILYREDPGVTAEKYDGKELIVSLTTFGSRIKFVALAIESLMEQTLQANRIVLWLDHRFEAPGSIPAALRLLEKRGLELRFCDDIGPHTKLVPALTAFPEALIVTVDDDCYYEYDLLDNLYRGYLSHPEAISAHWVISITGADGNLLPAAQWEKSQVDEKPHANTLAQGVGGVLYPPGVLHEDVTDVEKIKSLCPKADDVWFKAMSLLKGTKVVKVFSHNARGMDLYLHEFDPALALQSYNALAGGNDRQFKAVMDHYSLWDKLKED